MNTPALFTTRATTTDKNTPGSISSRMSDRVAGLPAWVVLIQLFIGLGWLRAVAEKLINPSANNTYTSLGT